MLLKRSPRKTGYLLILLTYILTNLLTFHKVSDVFCLCRHDTALYIQYNPNYSNADGSFTMAISNWFLSSLDILPIAQEKNILGYFRAIFLFYHENVCCVYSLEWPRRGDSNEYTQHTIIL